MTIIAASPSTPPAVPDGATDWMVAAACRNADARLFDQPTAAGRALCARCGVRAACVADAIGNDATGDWGGLSEEQRAELAARGWRPGAALPPVAVPNGRCGTPLGWDRGCRCQPCRHAHQPYAQAAEQAARPARLRGVNALRARRRLQELGRRGVSLEVAAAAAGIPAARLGQIAGGIVARIRRGEETVILALTPTACRRPARTRPVGGPGSADQPGPAGTRPRASAFGYQDDVWESWYKLLAQWAATTGHARVEQALVVDGRSLGAWTQRQRKAWWDGRMPAARARRLEALPGWVWRVDDSDWQAALERLRAWADGHGHAVVPVAAHTPDGFPLGAWVHDQRHRRNTGRLLPARAAALERVPGWAWEADTADFERGIAALRRFVAIHGHACPPVRYTDPDGFRLGPWVANHRKRRATLTPPQLAQLEALPWVWDVREARWQAAYAALVRFAEREGHTFVPAGHIEPPCGPGDDPQPLGHWVRRQRSYQQSRSHHLPRQRRRLLEALPGWTWDGYAARRRGAQTRAAARAGQLAVSATSQPTATPLEAAA